MALLPPLVRLNKKMFTRNSTRVSVNGIFRITDVDSVDWSDEIPYELVDAMNDGGAPVGKARGKYACEATIGIYADAAGAFESAVRLENPLAGTDLSACQFHLIIGFTEDIRTRQAQLVTCNIVGRPSRTVGNDGNAIVMQYKLQPTVILEDGNALVNLLPSF